jgi:predicted ATPase/class 3 adenylate cyclase
MEQSAALRRAPPTGLVTFLFSDIEGSTQRWEAHRDAMRVALRRHDALLRASIERHNGRVFKTMGDQFCAAFSNPGDAVSAAARGQRVLQAENWSAVGGLRVRMAIHTGVTDERESDYFGPAVNRVARLLAIANGGQVLLSGFSADLMRDLLPPKIKLHDLGTYYLKGLAQPERVVQLLLPGSAHAFPELRAAGAPNNLPLQLTPFLGRERELASVAQLVQSARLVTVSGPGGMGKTRLALRAGAALLDVFPDGVWFVDLAVVADPAGVPTAIAGALNVEDFGGSRPLLDLVAAAIGNKKSLVILDNCEHVVTAAAQAVQLILSRCPNVRTIATTREPLDVPGEHVYRIPPLAAPAATTLFVDRARALVPEFHLDARTAPLVEDIVRRLDGMPLAIELAAPKLRVLSVEQLSKGLDERLELLTAGSRTSLPRQQTLRALIGWSYDLLADAERSLLRQVAVFRGGWTPEAARAVCSGIADDGDALASLTRLVDKSLVVLEEQGERQRYGLLESTRQFGLERLREAEAYHEVAARHCRYFRDLSERLFHQFWKVNADVFQTQVRAELDNFRAAIAWGLDGNDVESAARIVGNLREFWNALLSGEGDVLTDRALAQLGAANPAVRARLLLVKAALTSDGGRGLEAATEAVEILRDGGDPALLVDGMRYLANSVSRAGDIPQAAKIFQSALKIVAPLGLPRLKAGILAWLGFGLFSTKQPDLSRRAFDEAHELLREAGDPTRIHQVLVNLAELHFDQGDVKGAAKLGRDALALVREFGNETGAMHCMQNLAAYELSLGNVAEAWALAREALNVALRRDRHMMASIAIQHLAQIAVRRNDPELGARLLGFVDATYARERHPREPTERVEYERIIALLRAAYAPPRLAALLAEGATLDEATAASLARTIPKPP